MEIFDIKIEKFVPHDPALYFRDGLAQGVLRKFRNTKVSQCLEDLFIFTSKPATKVIFLLLTLLDFEKNFEVNLSALRHLSNKSLTINTSILRIT